MDPQKFITFIKKYHRDNAVTLCLFKNDKCSEKIIKAHSIQNSFILDQLAIDGHVYTLDYIGDGSMAFVNTSRNKASVFTGFCSYHDSQVFSEIDFNINSTVEYLSPLQTVLFHFRAFSIEYWSKLNAVNSMSLIEKKMTDKNEEELKKIFPTLKQVDLEWMYENKYIISKRIEENKLGLKDTSSIYKSLVYQIENKKLHHTKNFQLIFNNPSSFAVSGFVTTSVDFRGNKVPSSDMGNSFLGINIFPNKEKTNVLLTWHKQDSVTETIVNQLSEMKEAEQKLAISKFSLLCSQNFVFSKTYIDGMQEDKKALIKKIIHPLSQISIPSEEIDLFTN